MSPRRAVPASRSPPRAVVMRRLRRFGEIWKEQHGVTAQSW